MEGGQAAASQQLQNEYDQIGNMTKVTDGAGRNNTHRYNALPADEGGPRTWAGRT